jgi:hypothetical protein
MRWRNTETPTFPGSAGSSLAPAVAETMELVDRSGNVVLAYTKDVAGTVGNTVTGATPTELDQFNDVSAYQESILAAGALSVTKVYSGLSLVGAGAVTLAAPDASMLGKTKMIQMVADNGDVTLALTNVVGQTSGTTATFNDVADSLTLIAGATKWIVLKEQGIALS